MKSKQRDEVRRLKLDAQQQLGEDGGIVDNGYYHEVPTMGMELNSSNRGNTGTGIRGSTEYNGTMSALEEEMSGTYTTDDSTHNRTANATEKYGTDALNQLQRGVGSASAATGNFGSNSIPSSTLLASAAGVAAAALSEYRNSTTKNNNRNSGDNAISSLTYQINNTRQSSPSFQPQPPVVPIQLSDNADNRSTCSTMSDLSDCNTNQGNRSSLTSLNSLLNGKPVPIDSPSLSSRKNARFQQQLPSQHQQFHHQHQNSIEQHQASATGRIGGSNGAIGIEHSRDFSNNLNALGMKNAIKNHRDSNATIPSEGLGMALAGQNSYGANSATVSNNPETSVTATSIGINKGRRLQTPEFNRHNAGRNSDNVNNTRRSSTDNSHLLNKIALLLDACETIRFPFKKKLMLNSLHMTAVDIPIKDLYGTVLGQSLYKLSLSGNRLLTIPRKLVTCLPSLKSMDISQCELHQLPERWNLPQLRRLNLSHNRLSDFPEEVS
jgi:hypothetical protein